MPEANPAPVARVSIPVPTTAGLTVSVGVHLTTVNIVALREGIFFADLIFSNGKEVSARPSDSIALALRTGAAIFAAEEILDEAGVAIPDEQEDEVEKFREFLDQISPEDFGEGATGQQPPS